ncbi:MAG TPA: DUF4282 domain-containing protein [Chitinophagaceae bacterium]|nr:DUF4282 domain-containing protein [Chitinophagaceae bacterium]
MEPTTNSTASQSTGFNWSDFLSFKTMITLKIIQIMYVVVAILITLGGLMSLFGGTRRGGYGGYDNFGGGSLLPSGPIMDLLIIVIGNILWRMWCELIIVFFRINKTLNNIDDKTKP